MPLAYTKIPLETFETLQLNAGIVTDTFDPDTAVAGEPMFATTGGISFKDTIEFQDFGEGIDNCPANTKELKRITSHTVTMSGTAITLANKACASFLAAADAAKKSGYTKFTPRNELKDDDFKPVWWIGDYGVDGWVAIEIHNALNTGGFQIKTNDKNKGTFPFEYTGHTGIANQDAVPYDIYLCEGTDAAVTSALLESGAAGDEQA